MRRRLKSMSVLAFVSLGLMAGIVAPAQAADRVASVPAIFSNSLGVVAGSAFIDNPRVFTAFIDNPRVFTAFIDNPRVFVAGLGQL